MSWLFMIIPEFYNDMADDIFYYFTLNKSTKSHFVLTILKSCFFLCFLSYAMGSTDKKNLVAI